MKQKPLAIIYEVRNEDIWLGWGLDRNNVRCDFRLGVVGGLEGIRIFCKGRSIDEAVHDCAISLFNDRKGIMADVKIPQDYPYEFYLYGSDDPVYRGRLRESS